MIHWYTNTNARKKSRKDNKEKWKRETRSKKEPWESPVVVCRIGGLNKVERGGFVAVYEEETDRGRPKGGRVHTLPWKGAFVPRSIPLLLSFFSFFSLSILLSHPLTHLVPPCSCSSSTLGRFFVHPPPPLLSLYLALFVFARLVNASRPQRTLHTQLFTGRLSPSPSVQGEGLLDREPRRIVLLQRGNAAIWRSKEDKISFWARFFFQGTIVSRWEIFMISVTWKSETSYRIIKDFEYPFEKKISNNFIRVQTNSNNIYNIDKLILI